jgi:membrane-associated protease RseP (regulator of RpoE activity)
MRSHLALVVIVVVGGAACSRALQPTHAHPCTPQRTQGAASGIGIIGMSLDQHANASGNTELVVDRVVPDGPAAAAGIHPGDRILAIEGTSASGMSIADAARRLRGPIDASVALVIATGNRPRDVQITRVAPSVLWSGAAGSPHAGGKRAEQVRPSDVAPATQVSAPPAANDPPAQVAEKGPSASLLGRSRLASDPF